MDGRGGRREEKSQGSKRDLLEEDRRQKWSKWMSLAGTGRGVKEHFGRNLEPIRRDAPCKLMEMGWIIQEQNHKQGRRGPLGLNKIPQLSVSQRPNIMHMQYKELPLPLVQLFRHVRSLTRVTDPPPSSLARSLTPPPRLRPGAMALNFRGNMEDNVVMGSTGDSAGVVEFSAVLALLFPQ